MTINGINGTNTQVGQMGMNQATDSYSKNIQNQIANAQKQLQELSSNEELTLEEKMKKRQEIQQQISDLNMQLRQHQMEQRKEQQAKKTSMDETLGGTNSKTGSKSAGLSQASMTAMISADTSLKQAKMQGNVASDFEGRAGVLEIEIKLDEARAVNGKTANTEGKKAELAKMEQKVMDVTAAQAETLGEANEYIEEAGKAENQSDDIDTEKENASAKEKAEGENRKADRQNTGNLGENGADIKSHDILDGVSGDKTVGMLSQPAVYKSVDIRL